MVKSIGIDAVVERTMADAPQVLHHVFALQGANQVFKQLETEESKVAYIIHTIGVQLYQADKELDPTKISYGPNDLRFHLMRSGPYFASYPFEISIRDLAEFEDLYYATCAKLKHLRQGVGILLSNGFKDRHDIHFTYHVEPLATLGDVGVGEFEDTLYTHANILYNYELMSLLDNGVKRKNMQTQYASSKQTMHGGESTNNDLDNVTYFEPGIWGHKEARAMNAMERDRYFAENLAWLKDVQGLQDMSDINCAMTFAMLAEKYRPIIAKGEHDWAMRPNDILANMPHGGMKEFIAWFDRCDTPEAPEIYDHAVEDEFIHKNYGGRTVHAYVSPYNLEERAKKLNNPDGPEMPCICDEDCICAALCASDPTQNCLCEENSLFVRVTEGMDIDDLDVPDLVRCRRSPTSVSTGSSETTTALTEERMDKEAVAPVLMIDGQLAAHFVAGASHYQQDDLAAENEIAEQTRQQTNLAKDLAKRMIQLDDAASITGSIHSMIPSMYSSDFDDAASIAPSMASKKFDDAASMAPGMASKQFDDVASLTPSMASNRFDDSALMTDSFDSTSNGESSSSKGLDGQPLRTSSLAYREALRQPFAKECPHPPKRASMAQRVFSSLSRKQ